MDQRARAAVFYEFLLGDVHELMTRTERLIEILVGDPQRASHDEPGLLSLVTLIQDSTRGMLHELMRDDGAIGLTVQRMMMVGSDVDVLSSRLVGLINQVEAADVARGELKSVLRAQGEMLGLVSRRLEALQRQSVILEEIRHGLSWWPRYGVPLVLNFAVMTIFMIVFDFSVRNWIVDMSGF